VTLGERFKDWTPDQAWPEDIPQLVRNIQRADGHPAPEGGGIIFCNGVRVRPGETFRLQHPRDFSPRTMAPAGDDAPDDLARRQAAADATRGHTLAGQSGHRETSSVDIWARPAGTLAREHAARQARSGRGSFIGGNQQQSTHAETTYDPYGETR
jgi:hypothetical protein